MTIISDKQRKCNHKFIHNFEEHIDIFNSVFWRLNHKCSKCGLEFKGEKILKCPPENKEMRVKEDD